MIRLNPHTLVFIKNYVIYYSENLSPVRYNHFEERVIKRKMSVQPRENSLLRDSEIAEYSRSKSLMKERSISRVQPSVIKAVQPMMLDVMKSFEFKNTTEAVVKAIELTERTWANQMSGKEKKNYAKLMLSSIIIEEDGSEGHLDDLIDVIVSVAKNKTLVNLFKKSTRMCLSCCS